MFRFIFAMQTIGESKAKIKGPQTDPLLPPRLPSLPGAILEEVGGAACRIPEFPDGRTVLPRILPRGIVQVIAGWAGCKAAPTRSRTGVMSLSW